MRIVSPLSAGLLVALLSLLFSPAHAQDDKNELKRWKKKAKEYVKNPLSLKGETEAYQSQIAKLKTEVAEQNDRLEKASEEALTRESEKQQLAAENTRLKERLATQTKEAEGLRSQVAQLQQQQQQAVAPEPDHKGVLFRVQIAAFAQDTLSMSGTDPANVIERDQEMSKYVLASFREYATAKEFRDKLRRMGLRDAWIVGYQDGIRTPLEAIMPKAAATPRAAEPNYDLEEIRE